MKMVRRLSRRARAPRLTVASTAALVLTAYRLWAASPESEAAGWNFIFPSTQSLGKLMSPTIPAVSAPDAESLRGSDEAASTANLGKNIIGAGVLALPAGAAGVMESARAAGTGDDPAMAGILLMFLVFGALNAGGFYIIGEVCARTGARTYQEAWSRTVGADTAWVPSAASLICCLTGTVACAAVIGGTATDLMSAVTGAPLPAMQQSGLLFGISGTILLPLCLLPSLAPLAFASLLGLIGVCLLAAVMVLRCLDGSYLPGGEFHSAVASATSAAEAFAASADPAVSEASVKGVLGSGLLFAAMLSNAFSAHYNAPSLYKELRDPESLVAAKEPDERAQQDAKLASFQRVTNQAFGFTGLMCMVVAIAGLQTFDTGALPLILDNYSVSDPLVFVARVGLGLCVLFEFPLLERCFRTTAAELLGCPEAGTHPAAVVASVALAAAIASVPGLEYDTVSAVGGAMGSSFLTYVAPALMALQLRTGQEPAEATRLQATAEPRTQEAGARFVEALVLRSLAVFGVAVGGLGVAQAAGLGLP